MTCRPFAMVDVFSHDAFFGNPVAVVLDADGMDDRQRQQISSWTNLSETTFLQAPTDEQADYAVRIFTPSTELPFAGHPTLGSCRAWLDAGGVPRRDGVVVQACEVGLVEIRVGADGMLAFAAPPLVTSGPLSDDLRSEVVAALGIADSQVIACAHVDNGPGWVGVLLASASEVLDLEPSDSPLKIGVAGFHATDNEATYEVRAFFPEGVRSIEDPVTGSLNASLAQWLLAEGLVQAPYVATQGSRLGRRGRIALDLDEVGQVWVGGRAVVRITGEIDLGDPR